MKLLLKNNKFILAVLLTLLQIAKIECQFAPAAGQTGTTAIRMDSSVFVSWAVQCSVSLGVEDISDPNSNLVSVGNTSMVLGPPGNGVISLGDGGSAIVTFDYPIQNGTGWDFAVFENSFSDNFLELGYVEVSSNGIDFIRFPAISNTQDTVQIGGFGSLQAENLNNLAGKYRATFGTPFDLEELSNEPFLDVNSISHVKIIDVIGSINDSYCNFDSDNNKINDPWPTPFPSSGFDLDAVGVINQSPSNITSNEISKKYIEQFKIANQTIEFKIAHPKSQKIFINIIDLNAKNILKSEHFYLPNNAYNYLDINEINTGFYIINIYGEYFYESLKILIP